MLKRKESLVKFGRSARYPPGDDRQSRRARRFAAADPGSSGLGREMQRCNTNQCNRHACDSSSFCVLLLSLRHTCKE